MIKLEQLEILKKVNWYRQGGAVRIFYGAIPYLSGNKLWGWDRCIMHQKGEVNAGFFDRDIQRKCLMEAIEMQKNNRNYIDGLIEEWRETSQKVLDFCALSFNHDIGTWSDEELRVFLSKFQELHLDAWVKSLIIECSDPDGVSILHGIISVTGKSLTSEEFSTILAPFNLTFVQKEFAERIAIAQKKIEGHDISADLAEHAKQYSWYKDNWSYVHELDVTYFEELTEDDCANIEDRLKELKAARTHFAELQQNREQIIKQKSFSPGELSVFYMFARMTDWRDERKENSVHRPNTYLYQILKHIMKENNLSEDMAGMLRPDEVTGWKLADEKRKDLEERARQCVFICSSSGECEWLYDKDAELTYKIITKADSSSEIKGFAANRGVARGVVCIVETKEDFAKMKPGDVLVASMTRPEYVPLMKIAGAIITNEGGITCHAAIVSRELGIPCVIGTKFATQTLNNGDTVEINVSDGSVRIISSI